MSSLTWLLVIAAVVLAALCGRSLLALSASRSASAEAASALDHALTLADRIEALRTHPQRIRTSAPDEAELFSRTADVLAGAGVSPGTVRVTVTPQGDAGVQASQGPSIYRRRVVQLDLQPISVQQVGVFLAKWREQRPEWVPSRIELTHAARLASARVEPSYVARISLTSTYAPLPVSRGEGLAPAATNEARRDE